MKETRQEKFLKEIMGSDTEFFEKYLKNLPEDKLQKFLDENPDFLQD